MARRSPTLALLPFLIACATTHPSPAPTTSQDSSVLDTAPTYLVGVSTRFSLRLDELQPEQQHPTRLPDGVVAGDDEVTVAAAMFRDGEHFALDLVVRNRGDEPLDLHRAGTRLYDDEGTRLDQIDDWPGAELYGLRARTRSHRDWVTMEGSRLAQGSPSRPAPGGGSHEAAPRKQVGALTASANSVTQPAVTDLGWLASVPRSEPGIEAPNAPPMLLLDPGQSAPYWIYWRSDHEPHWPMRAVVEVGGKKLLFQFESPGAASGP